MSNLNSESFIGIESFAGISVRWLMMSTPEGRNEPLVAAEHLLEIIACSYVARPVVLLDFLGLPCTWIQLYGTSQLDLLTVPRSQSSLEDPFRISERLPYLDEIILHLRRCYYVGLVAVDAV